MSFEPVHEGSNIARPPPPSPTLSVGTCEGNLREKLYCHKHQSVHEIFHSFFCHRNTSKNLENRISTLCSGKWGSSTAARWFLPKLICRRDLSHRRRLAISTRSRDTPPVRQLVLSHSSQSFPFGQFSLAERATLIIHNSERNTLR